MSDQNQITVHTGSAVLPVPRGTIHLECGETLADIIEALKLPEWAIGLLVVTLQGATVPRKWWGKIKPRPGTIIGVSAVPAGLDGDNTLMRQVAGILGTVLPAIGGLAIGGVPGMVIQVVGGLAGVLVTSAMFSPPTEPLEAESFSLMGGQNQLQQWGIVPKTYGKTLMVPPMAAEPITEVHGQDHYLKLLFCVGHQPVKVSDIKIGDLSIGEIERTDRENESDYGTIAVEISTGWRGQQDAITLFSADVHEEQLDRPLLYADSWDDPSDAREFNANVVSWDTQENTIEIGVDLVFPEGLARQEGNALEGERVDVAVRFRMLGATSDDAWENVIPDWVVTEEDSIVRTWTDSEVWQFMEDLDVQLDGIVVALNAIDIGLRTVSDLLDEQLYSSLSGWQGYVNSWITEESLSAPRVATGQAVNANFLAIQQLMDTATEVSGRIATGASSFNDTLSTVITIGNFIDGLVRVGRYIEQGYGPDLQTLTWFQRWSITRRGLERLFGAPPDGSFSLTNLDAEPGQRWFSVNWSVPVGRYEIQVRRITEPGGLEREQTAWYDPLNWHSWDDQIIPADSGVHDRLNVYAVRSVADSPAVSAAALAKYAFVAVRIRATEFVNGAVDQFNCMVDSPIPWYDGAVWVDPVPSDTTWESKYRNPAWALADILRGSASNKPVNDTQVDGDRLVEFETWCAAQNYNFDHVFETTSTLQNAMKTVTRVGKGSPTIRDGQYSVVFDSGAQTPVAVLSTRTGGEMNASKAFAELPHALRVRFIDAEQGYQAQEIVVYADGYGPGLTTATLFEQMDFTGATSREHAVALARYAIGVGELRPEIYKIPVDWEHLTFERGDTVLIENDVTLWGLGSARVTTVHAGGVGTDYVLIDEEATMVAGTVYQAQLRKADGTILYANAVTFDGTQKKISFSPDMATGAAEDDLIMWGETESVSAPCIVTEVRPTSDAGAIVTLVDEAPGVHSAGEFPEYDPNVTLPPRPEWVQPPPPVITGIVTDERALVRMPNGLLKSRIAISLRIPRGENAAERLAASIVDAADVEYRLSISEYELITIGGVERQWGPVPPWTKAPRQSGDLVTVYASEVMDSRLYDVRVRVVTVTGQVSKWAEQWSVFVWGQLKPPPDVMRVEHFHGELRWEYPDAPIDHDGFHVRVVQGEAAAWLFAQPAHEGVLRTNLWSIPNDEGGARTYFIKAVDVAGHESKRAARVVVDLGPLPLESVAFSYSHNANSFPDTKENMTRNGGTTFLEVDAGATESFWRDVGQPAYDGGAAHPAYHTDYLRGLYTWTHTPEGGDLPYDYGVDITVSDGHDDWLLEMKHDGDLLWPEQMDQDIWPISMESAFWPLGLFWGPFTGKIPAVEDVEYEFRIRVPAAENQLIVEEITECWDKPWIVEYIENFDVAGVGTVRLPITKAFESIETVNLTLEYTLATATAMSVKVMDKSETLGPEVQVYNAAGARVAGRIDAQVQGY